MSKLVIVDGHAIIHRAYHSIPPLTSNGQPVNGLYGFYSMLLTAINNLNPKYLVVCLDSPGPNFRNHEFLGYRAKRKPADSDLISQLPLLKSTLEQANIATFSMGGFEADDLIAAITAKALKKINKNKKKLVNEVVIITGDKDLMQLVDKKVSLFVPIRGLSETKIFKPEDVQEKLGVLPTQVVDLKALMGDMSDNYPGVAGIGPKVATDLLSEYQNLNNIYQNLDQIKPSIREKLEKDKDNAYLSQKLATLVSNIPLDFKLSSAKLTSSSFQKLISLFKIYNFKSLIQRVEKQNPTSIKINHKNEIQTYQTSLF
ncbi:MAG: 5'-3' exonuclease H3TH domain-containing protein [Candidatus Shapirobacteria bacterium]|nr:5'-3' exonuclease H3TH domain-containing protein [Candidatus Shapirobacteria bacterium]MDD3002719.1 5'-3' exonuclease H3TH domain-containing protein [Candidatus Shapirobacteria bacterium]MDD4382908.1 5'-3' exonuclease H3TH domain-containing protein [Candidatus Shapirobacteria bacterium]